MERNKRQRNLFLSLPSSDDEKRNGKEQIPLSSMSSPVEKGTLHQFLPSSSVESWKTEDLIGRSSLNSPFLPISSAYHINLSYEDLFTVFVVSQDSNKLKSLKVAQKHGSMTDNWLMTDDWLMTD